MSRAKDAFKAIAASIKSDDYDTALAQANKLLKACGPDGPDASQALLYRGLALTKLGRNEEADKSYVHAFKLQPTSSLAYPAVCKQLRKAEHWDLLGRVIETRIQAAVDIDDGETCAAALQELVELRVEHGTEDQLHKALSLLSPSSPAYSILQRVTPPAGTYVPLQEPQYPSDSSKPLPKPLPHVLHLLGSLPLLLHLLLHRQRAIHTSTEAEVKVRRQRIGAKSEKDVRREVEQAVLSDSPGAELVALLREVAGHPGANDDLRRQVEVDEFRFWRRLTQVTSPNDPAPRKPPQDAGGDLPTPALFFPAPALSVSKDDARRRADGLAEGFILLGVGGLTEEAWTWAIEGRDEPTIHYDLELLHKYANTFPTSTLTDFIDDYCRWFKLPLPEPDEELPGGPTDGGKGRKPKSRKKSAAMNARERRKARRQAEREGQLSEDLDREERDELVAAMTKLVSRLSESVFAQRVMARVYIQEEDWHNVIEYAEASRKLLTTLESERGCTMQSARHSADQALAVALVPYFPPKHHARAARLLNGVLKAQPDNYEARFARSQIYQAAGNWAEARKGFQLLVGSNRTDAETLAAQEEVAWCFVNEGKIEQGRAMLLDIVKAVRALAEESDTDVVHAKTWWRLGQAEAKSNDPATRALAEDRFMDSIRASPTFAPAYTALGVCFAEATLPDNDRALKCFQKAFELDATETDAAFRLASGYALQEEWATVRTIATRVMSGEGGVEGAAGASLLDAKGRFAPKNAWAWKALGSTEMHYKNHIKAAQAFQIALRTTPDDVSLWLLLGRAYVKSGKHVAGLKALQHAIELDSSSWVARYHLAELHIHLGAFDEALDELDRASALAPEAAVGIKAALAGTMLSLARTTAAAGFRERSRRALLACVDAATNVLAEHPLWACKVIGDAALDMASSESDVDVAENRMTLLPTLRYLAGTPVSPIAGLGSVQDLLAETSTGSTHKAAVFFYAYRADQLQAQPRTVDPALYDLASACHALASAHPDMANAATVAAMSAIRLALNHDATDEPLWNAMGVIVASRSAQLAQHAFVVSLECYDKDPAVWTNLGFLYLEAEDVELAGDCFLRAQTLDPEHAAAWLGQGLIARNNGDADHARNLLSHAVTLSAGSLLEADLALAVTIFDRIQQASDSALHQPTFALRHYTHVRPDDAQARHLYALFCERLGLFDEATHALSSAVRLFEQEFERSESPAVERSYSVALASLGRTSLASRAYDSALKTFTDCCDLVDMTDQVGVQARIGQALAHYWLGNLDGSLEAFQAALDGCDSKDDIAVMLTRTLWNVGGSDARETAKSNMLDSLAHEQPNEQVVATVGAIAMLTADADLVEAALSELRSNSSLAQVVLCVHALVEDRPEDALAILETAVVSHPDDPTARLHLARALLALGELQGTREALAGFKSASVRSTASAELLRGAADALDGQTGRKIERTIMLEPWNADAWAALAHERA